MPAPASAGRLTTRLPDPRPEPGPAGLHDLARDGLPGSLLLVPPVEGPRPLLVFFHGAGGHARSGLPLLRHAAEEAGVLVLLPSSVGTTWDLLAGGLGPDVAALDAALWHVVRRWPVDRLALGGFSDGGSYALSLGLANGDLVEAVLAFSPGFASPPSRVGAPRVSLSHGDADRVLPVDRCGRRVQRLLRGAGYDVRYEEFAGGHVVPPEQVRAALSWWLD